MIVRNVFLFVFALFSAALLGLAAGAVWMVATLYLHHPLPWLALPIGALLAWAIRGYVRPAGAGAALLAVWATVLAAILQQRERFAGRRIGVVLTGGNVDLQALPWSNAG